MARPRNFTTEEVLDKATEVFWRCGYEGASMSELSDKMGMSPPSIYGAFGSKRGLFDEVLNRYDAGRLVFFSWISEATSARGVAERALLGIADAMTKDPGRLGCLLLQGGVSCGPTSSEVPTELARRRRKLELSLASRFERAKNEGDLTESADPNLIAQYISMVWDGLGVRAAAGASSGELRQIATLALKALPIS